MTACDTVKYTVGAVPEMKGTGCFYGFELKATPRDRAIGVVLTGLIAFGMYSLTRKKVNIQ